MNGWRSRLPLLACNFGWPWQTQSSTRRARLRTLKLLPAMRTLPIFRTLRFFELSANLILVWRADKLKDSPSRLGAYGYDSGHTSGWQRKRCPQGDDAV